MKNPIEYSDIIGGSVGDGLSSLIKQIQQVRQESITSIADIKKAMAGITLPSAGGKGGSTIPKQAADIDQLRKVYEGLKVDVKLYDEALKALSNSERESKRVMQASTEIARAREGSYDSLSAQYTALKVLVNNMTQAERENTDAGRLLVANLKDIYEKMNLMQQATGKFQLQVGQYGKAVNGLNIATQQVIRELPALANSPTTFAIAISNNIPILLDYIANVKKSKVALYEQMAAAEAAGDAEKVAALKAEAAKLKNLSVTKLMVKSLFSWQSGIVLLLTVLPFFLRALKKKKDAQGEYNDILKETIDLQKELTKADLKAEQEGARATTKAKTLYDISQDQNRSYEERLAVARELQRLYPDYLGNMDAEAIVAGKASSAYDKLTESLIKKAKAQAYLNKITEVESKKLEFITAFQYEKKLEDIKKKNYDTYIVQSSAGATVVRRTEEQARLAKEAEINKITSEYNKRLAEYENLEAELMSRISGFGLLSDDDSGSGSGRGAGKDKIGDYFFDMMSENINAMDEGLGKALAQLTLSYRQSEKKYEEARNELLEKQKTANGKEREEIDKQLEYINRAIVASQTAYIKKQNELLGIDAKGLSKETQKMTDEAREAINKELEVEKTRLEQERALRDSAIYAEYEALSQKGENLVELKKSTNEKLLASEIQYWQDYLKVLSESGKLTIEEYNKVWNKLMSLQGSLQGKEKVTATKEQKQKKRKGYGGFFEFVAAQTNEYGEKDGNENRKVQDKYLEYFKDVDKAVLKSIGYMEEWMDTRVKMAEIAVESAKKEQDAAKSLLDYELEARANGYANNVTLARKEYEEKKKLTKKAAQDANELAKVQRALDTAQQIQSLVTASANIWSAEGIKGALGVPLALATIATMWASFGAAKIKAEQLARSQSVQYGEGMSEYLGYGGSHASGHDIDFGVRPDGTRRRVERGEMIGVVNKRNVSKYGVERLTDIFSSLNHGTFENSYGNAFSGGIAIPKGADLHKLERGVSELVAQGDRRVVSVGGKTIVYYKNTKKTIRS